MSTPSSDDPAYRAGRFSAARPVAWLYLNVFPHIDRRLLRWTNGRFSITPGIPTLLLETVGAKSGQRRETPLVYAPDGERIILIASNGGQPQNPAWYYNMRANPQVRVTARGRTRDYIARELDGAEREAAWNKALRINPGYDVYKERTAGIRQIPVMLLEPAS